METTDCNLFVGAPPAGISPRDARYGDRPPALWSVITREDHRAVVSSTARETLGDERYDGGNFVAVFNTRIDERRAAVTDPDERAQLAALAILIGRNLGSLDDLRARTIARLRRLRELYGSELAS